MPEPTDRVFDRDEVQSEGYRLFERQAHADACGRMRAHAGIAKPGQSCEFEGSPCCLLSLKRAEPNFDGDVIRHWVRIF
jgi:hypothetical protein